jgi:putative PIN family toxin of toxin-antitoxin system
MTSERRFDFDTNVLVSAALFSGSRPREALAAARRTGRLLASYETFDEISEVLLRARFDRYLPRETREEFLTKLAGDIELVGGSLRVRQARDPDDDKFLELAVTGQAECIISGDADLLVLSPFRWSDADLAIDIVTPRAFLEEWLPSKGAS